MTGAVAALLCTLIAGCTASTDGSCNLDGLPAEAGRTVELIESGGPFPYPRNDGVVFGNYERLLPQHERGFYHEYTVPTPGLKHRGQRRIVTGGQPLDDPAQFYYTDDHYESFCLMGGM